MGKEVILGAAKTAGKAAGKAAGATGALALAGSDLIKAFCDYRKTCEAEITRREYIRAERDVAIERIRAQTDVIKTYLDQAFRERRHVIDGNFAVLERALRENQPELACRAMTSIEEIMKKSPLNDVRQIMNDVNDPRVESIEI
jgi:hypothetical protein